MINITLKNNDNTHNTSSKIQNLISCGRQKGLRNLVMFMLIAFLHLGITIS